LLLFADLSGASLRGADLTGAQTRPHSVATPAGVPVLAPVDVLRRDNTEVLDGVIVAGVAGPPHQT